MGRHHSRGVHLSVHLSRMTLLTTNGWSPTALPTAMLWLLRIPGCFPLPSALGGAIPRADPTPRASSGCHSAGEEESGSKTGRGKGKQEICYTGVQQTQSGGWGSPSLYSSASGLGTGTGAMKGMQRSVLQSPSPREGHALDGHILHAGTGRYTGEGSCSSQASPAAVGVGSPKPGGPASTGQQGHGGGTGWVND